MVFHGIRSFTSWSELDRRISNGRFPADGSPGSGPNRRFTWRACHRRELQNQLAESQRILEDQKRMCTSIEKERDDLKATLGAEVTMLKDLVFSLQYEVEWQKRHSVPSDGKEEGTIGSVSSMENGYHSGEQIKSLSYPTHLEHHSFCGLENISPPRFTVQSAAVKLDLPLRTLSTTFNHGRV